MMNRNLRKKRLTNKIVVVRKKLMKKMKGMPGMGNFQQMMGKMGGGQGGKVNMNAMNARMAQNLRQAKMKERMQEKLRRKQAETEAAGSGPAFDPERMEHSRFSTGGAAEKTPLNPETAKKGNKKKRRKGQKKQA